MARRKKNPVWLAPIAIVGGLAATGVISYAVGKHRGETKARSKNLFIVTSDATAIPVLSGVTKGGAWVLVVPDKAHEAPLRVYLTDLAISHPNVNFVLFSHRMRAPNKLPVGAWGGAEGIVDRQSLGISEFREEQWRSAIASMVSKVLDVAQNLGALPSGLLGAVGIS